MASQNEWMKQAIELALENVKAGRGGPFGAIVVANGELVSTGVNLVTSTNDPSAHAEVVAIRTACQSLGRFELNDCELYTSCEPCPMCLGAIYWARVKTFYFSCNRYSAAKAGFDDDFIYNQVPLLPATRTIPGIELLPELGTQPFEEWTRSITKTAY